MQNKCSVKQLALVDRPLSRAAVTFPAGGDHLRLAAARHHKSGWRRRETFPAAANLAVPVIRTNKG